MQGQIKVVDIKDLRYLLLNNAIQTVIDKETRSSAVAFPYYMEMAVFINPSAKNALCIGLGGGVVPSRFKTYDIEMDVVDIDPEMVEVARSFFGFGGEVYIQDGRYFLQNTDKRYDIIILDAYSGYTPPAHLFTKEMFEEIDKKLSRDGVLAVNTFGFSGDELERSVFYTLKAVFPHVYIFSTAKKGIGNHIFFATKKELDDEEIDTNIDLISKDELQKIGFHKMLRSRSEIDGGGEVLKDNYNPAEFLALDASVAWREKNYRLFGNDVLVGGVT